MSLVLFSPDGPEQTFSVEQLASDVYWRTGGTVQQEVVGYRSQSLFLFPFGLPTTRIRGPIITPMLYGDRLEMFGLTTPRDTVRLSPEFRNAVHPFAYNRDRYYTFAGGDTVQTIVESGRAIPIVRIAVTPNKRINVAAKLFTGDVYVDATRWQIVRMRGRIVLEGPDRPFNDNILQGNIFVDLVSTEYDRSYWLPREQRWEFQLGFVAFTETRAIVRVVSRFVDVVPGDTAALSRAPARDSFPFGRLTGFDDQGQLSSFGDWRTALGALSSGAGARDFDEFGPHVSGSRVRLSYGTRYFSQTFRYNNIEGAFSGGGLKLDFGPFLPGGRARVHAGYAWREHVVRGGGSLEYARGSWEVALRGERKLAITRELGSGVIEEPDAPPLYADRGFFDRRVSGLLARRKRSHGVAWRFEVSRVSDAVAGRGIRQYAPNSAGGEGADSTLARAAFPGTFWLARTEIRLNPSVGPMSISRGIQLRLAFERADGAFTWNRYEAGVSLRATAGRTLFKTSIDAGVVRSSAVPPQALYQLRSVADFFTTKGEAPFTGDRGAAVRASVGYTLPVLNAPLGRGLPGLAPGPYAGVQVGWTDASAATSELLDRFGWRTSEHARTAVEMGLRFFGGSVALGAVRPTDIAAKWRFGFRASAAY